MHVGLGDPRIQRRLDGGVRQLRGDEGVEDVAGAGAVRLVAENLGTLHSPDEVRMLVTATRAQLGSDPAVVALAAVVDDKPVIIVATNAAAREAGQRAGALAKLVAGILGGGGGGKDDLAQGGGTDVDKIAGALVAVRTTIAG